MKLKFLKLLFGVLFFLLNKKPLVNDMATLGGIPPNRKGKPRTEETKRKISQAKKAFYQIPANIEAISGENNSFYGKTHSKETRIEISTALRGQLTGKSNPFYGQTHSPETKKLLSMKMKERFLSEEGHRLAQKLQEKNMKPVKIWNEQQEHIFDSINEACRQLNLDIGALWRVLNKKQKIYKGHKACYLNL